ncbi:cell division initiation protein [Streptomyces abyssalis]|uniref:Cell division initiation protein n=1 Tax=Streptomyces abyssalis TaxID=933944 RepID=A0A1E7JHD4_9ACTN|nr:ATP synthase F0 subunit B [Streptomyces abyssalis]OEU85860.1 cell division initiation protein [Streptomyces abyssalis]OEU92675.1 cell division initiation protein [Streptomyces abyssalis]
MDVQQKLDEIVTAVDSARAMPMSASCVVNRAELLAMLEEVRQALPGSLAQAEQLIGGREQMVAEAQAEAQRIIESGHAERGSLVSGTEVVRQAQAEAEQVLAQARQEAAEIRAEADDYVDSKLANFEVVLSKTIGSVERGREKLLGSGPGSEEWNEEYAEDAPERSTDPRELRERADNYVDARLGSVSAVLSKTLEAVGRGRSKLLGHAPSDDLGAHMAAQDAAEQGVHTSDADYMADLAALNQGQSPAGSRPAPAAPVAPAQPGYEPVAAAGADPYAAHAQQEAYYGGQDAYAYQQQYAYYGQQPDPYYAQQAQPQQNQPYAGHPQAHPGMQPQQPQLDETSFFDTSMIDLDQVREYEARHGRQHGQGHGQGHGDPYGQGYGQGGR